MKENYYIALKDINLAYDDELIRFCLINKENTRVKFLHSNNIKDLKSVQFTKFTPTRKGTISDRYAFQNYGNQDLVSIINNGALEMSENMRAILAYLFGCHLSTNIDIDQAIQNEKTARLLEDILTAEKIFVEQQQIHTVEDKKEFEQNATYCEF